MQPVVSYVLRLDRDQTALNSSSKAARRLPLLFSHPVDRDMKGSYLHIASLEAKKEHKYAPHTR